MKKYNHSFANYPKSFKGCVVSPYKICMQFSDPQIKLRVADRDTSDLIKLPSTEFALPVSTSGVDIETTAVGCVMPVLEGAQFGLLEAYLKYGRLHSDEYKKRTDNNFLDFLLKMRVELDRVITILSN